MKRLTPLLFLFLLFEGQMAEVHHAKSLKSKALKAVVSHVKKSKLEEQGSKHGSKHGEVDGGMTKTDKRDNTGTIEVSSPQVLTTVAQKPVNVDTSGQAPVVVTTKKDGTTPEVDPKETKPSPPEEKSSEDKGMPMILFIGFIIFLIGYIVLFAGAGFYGLIVMIIGFIVLIVGGLLGDAKKIGCLDGEQTVHVVDGATLASALQPVRSVAIGDYVLAAENVNEEPKPSRVFFAACSPATSQPIVVIRVAGHAVELTADHLIPRVDGATGRTVMMPAGEIREGNLVVTWFQDAPDTSVGVVEAVGISAGSGVVCDIKTERGVVIADGVVASVAATHHTLSKIGWTPIRAVSRVAPAVLAKYAGVVNFFSQRLHSAFADVSLAVATAVVSSKSPLHGEL